MTNKGQFKDLIRLLCTNNIKRDGTFIMPHRHTANLDPVLNKADFELCLDAFVDWAEQEASKHYWLSWSTEYKFFSYLLRELFYDDKGYFIPYFGFYVSANRERQKPNDFVVDAVGVRVPTYNFELDEPSDAFFRDLFNHIGNFKQFLKERGARFGGQTSEWIEDMNTGFKGEKILAKPYEKQIEIDVKKLEKGE